MTKGSKKPMVDLQAVYAAMKKIEKLDPQHDPEEWPKCSCGNPLTAHWRNVVGAMIVGSLACDQCNYRITADRPGPVNA